MVRRMDRQGELLRWCRKSSGCARLEWDETDELLQTGTEGHQRIWQNAVKNSNSQRRKSPSQGGKELEN